jgi:pyruvate-formate lyase-activating enzyme
MCTNCDSYIMDPDEKYGLAKHREKISAFKAGRGDRAVYYRNGEHADYFLFTGGEPTLNPEFFRLLGEYRKEFPAAPLTLLTNGRAFYHEDFARSTLRVGGVPFDLAIPVHGPDATTHDSVTRAPGSFVETIEGLKHVLRHRAPGQGVEIRIILHRWPARWLERTLRFLLESFPDTSAYRLNLVYFEVEGQAEKNFEHIRITLSECAAFVDGCFDLLRKFPDLRLYHFPLCALPERLWPYAWRSLPRYEIKHVEACGRCAMNDVCMGPHDWYPRLLGTGEFRPYEARRNVSLTGNPFHPIAEVLGGESPAVPMPIRDEVKDESARW